MTCLEHSSFVFQICFVFRYSDFEFMERIWNDYCLWACYTKRVLAELEQRQSVYCVCGAGFFFWVGGVIFGSSDAEALLERS